MPDGNWLMQNIEFFDSDEKSLKSMKFYEDQGIDKFHEIKPNETIIGVYGEVYNEAGWSKICKSFGFILLQQWIN